MPRCNSPLGSLPTELLISIFSFVVDGWTMENFNLLCIARRIQPIIGHLLCEKPPELRSYKDVDKLLRYLDLYPTYAPSVKYLSIRLKNSDTRLSPNRSIDPVARMDHLSLAKLCYLCTNIQKLTFWSPFEFPHDLGQNDPDFDMFGFNSLCHIQLFNNQHGFLVSLLRKYIRITTLEILGREGYFRGWLGVISLTSILPHSEYSQSSKDVLPNFPLLPVGLTSILMPDSGNNRSVTTVPDILVHDLGLNSTFPPLQVLELDLADHEADKLLFPLLRRIKRSIRSLRLSGNDYSIEAALTSRGERSSHCNQFYSLLLQCENLQLLSLHYLWLAAWDHGSTGYFTPALRTLIVDQITGTSIDFALWLSTIICASVPLSTVKTHFMREESPFTEEEAQLWKTIFHTHGVTFINAYDWCL
ncbi:hypothetical protein BT69DRAFT_227672 [Atractiella rhizophila]|nr:hypothetical protein BT69DRAFT_227672 [Atractiella rhizophila]